MRILTWNLDHGCRGSTPIIEAQSTLIASAQADVAVLTDLPVEWSQPAIGRVVSACERPARRGLESWVGIVGDGIHAAPIDVPFTRMASAALLDAADGHWVIYGSVLPWNAAITRAPYLVRPGESASDLFERVLGEQVADIEYLRDRYSQSTFIWAGDFNQPLEGPNRGFSRRNRELLAGALDALGLVAYNRDLAHANTGSFAIDLICGPASRGATAMQRIDPVVDDMALSDHAGYVVDL